jgi:hypothetical protein
MRGDVGSFRSQTTSGQRGRPARDDMRISTDVR